MASKKRKQPAAAPAPTLPKAIPFAPQTRQKLAELINLRDAANEAARRAVDRINDIISAVQELLPPGYVLQDIAIGFIYTPEADFNTYTDTADPGAEPAKPWRDAAAEIAAEFAAEARIAQLDADHAAEVAEAAALDAEIAAMHAKQAGADAAAAEAEEAARHALTGTWDDAIDPVEEEAAEHAIAAIAIP